MTRRWLLLLAAITVTALLVVSCGPQAAPAPAPAAPAAEEPAAEEPAAEEPAAEEPAAEEPAAEEPAAEEPAAEEPAAEEPAAEEAVAEPTKHVPDTSAEEGKVNIDAIFPDAPGKDLVFRDCTGCHSWVPLVIVGFNEDEWERNARDHRDRVAAATDEDYELVYAYLAEYFNADTPVPDLPQELLDQWTSY